MQRQGLIRVLCGALLGAAALSAPAAALDSEAVDRWEQLSWLDPERVPAGLQADLASTPAHTALWLEGQRVLAEAQLWRGDFAALDLVLGAIDATAVGGRDAALQRDARSLATCLRAGRQRKAGTLGRADVLLQQATASLAQAVSPGQRQSCAMAHGQVLQGLGRYDEAAGVLQQAIRDADATGRSWRRSELRTTLADVLWRGGQREAATRLREEALGLARAHGDLLAESHAMTVIAIQLADQDRGDEELSAMERALALAREAGAVSDEAHCLANLSDYHLRHDQPAKALAVAERALPMARRTRNPIAEGLAQVNAGLALVLLGRKDEGVRRIRASVEADLRADDIVSAADSLLDLGRYLERAGHPGDAYQTLREYRDLADEVARRTRQTQLVELQEAFEVERRRDERARLLEDNQLKEELWRQRELSDRFWLLMTGAAGVLAALAALIYHRLRQQHQHAAADHQALRVASAVDPLTGLGNRRLLPPLDVPSRGLVALLDLDHFKRINDRHGHQVGDAVLVEVAQRLRTVAVGADLLLRWGGEEFLLLAPSLTPEQAPAVVQRLLGVLATAPVVVDEQPVLVTTSIGFVCLPPDARWPAPSWAQALGVADAVLRQAKSAGRNRAEGLVGLAAAEVAPDWQALAHGLAEAVADGQAQVVTLAGPRPPLQGVA